MKTLVIKLSSLGDIIHGIPVVHALRDLEADGEIHWLVSAHLRSMVELIPGVTRIYTFDRNAWRQVPDWPRSCKLAWHLVQHLRREGYDRVIDLQCLLRSGLLARLSGCSQRIGLDHAREGAALFYTRTVQVQKRNLHAVEQNLAILKDLYPEWNPPAHPDFSLALPPKLKDSMAQRLKQLGIDGPYCLLAPGARWPSKEWPVAYYQELALQMRKQTGMHIIFTGSETEARQWQQWEGWQQSRVHNLMGETSLQQLAVLIQGAVFLLGNDSAPIHIASCFQTPVVTLMGPTRPGKTGPYTEALILQEALDCAPCLKRRCPRTDAPKLCLTRLTPERVWAAIQDSGWLPA